MSEGMFGQKYVDIRVIDEIAEQMNVINFKGGD